jgi:4-hydroxy-2-oxoglutarate aldolase
MGAGECVSSMDLAGIIPPVPTPFEGESVDLFRFRENLGRWLAWEGMPAADGPGPGPYRLAGVLVAGSNGEGPLLEDGEIDALVRVARQVVPAGRLLLVGTGRESTAGGIAAARRAADLGADAVLVSPPGYFREQVPASDLIRHYEAIAASTPVPIILYSAPRFSGMEIPVPVVKRLASDPAIAGLKDSSTDTGRIVEILAGDHPVEGDGFRVMAGNATVFYPALACGAAGGILAAACVVPGLACGLMAAWAANNQDAARRIQKRLSPLARAVTVGYGIAGLKATLDHIGLHGGNPRPPLMPLAAGARSELIKVLEHALWAEDQDLASGPRLGDPVGA